MADNYCDSDHQMEQLGFTGSCTLQVCYENLYTHTVLRIKNDDFLYFICICWDRPMKNNSDGIIVTWKENDTWFAFFVSN